MNELKLLELPGGQQLRLKSGGTEKPIKAFERAAVLGAPFSSVEQARTGAERAKAALLYWALEHRLGIDFGDGHPRGTITEAGRKRLEVSLGGPIRPDVHGIDIYERQPDLKFVHSQVDATLGVNPDSFVETFAREFTGARQLTAKQSLSAEIYSSSFFDISPRSRFITLVTAVEALLEPGERPIPVQLLVKEMETLTRAADIDPRTRDSIIGSLQWFKAESIGQAGKSLAARLLPDKNYDGRSAPAFFTYCYGIRSNLVHRGVMDPSVNPLLLANTMQAFVADLLLASCN
jgi:hypothetical protein